MMRATERTGTATPTWHILLPTNSEPQPGGLDPLQHQAGAIGLRAPCRIQARIVGNVINNVIRAIVCEATLNYKILPLFSYLYTTERVSVSSTVSSGVVSNFERAPSPLMRSRPRHLYVVGRLPEVVRVVLSNAYQKPCSLPPTDFIYARAASRLSSGFFVSVVPTSRRVAETCQIERHRGVLRCSSPPSRHAGPGIAVARVPGEFQTGDGHLSTETSPSRAHRSQTARRTADRRRRRGPCRHIKPALAAINPRKNTSPTSSTSGSWVVHHGLRAARRPR